MVVLVVLGLAKVVLDLVLSSLPDGLYGCRVNEICQEVRVGARKVIHLLSIKEHLVHD